MTKKKEKSPLHHPFTCTLCGTDINLPACCEPGSVRVENGVLVCDLCGSNKTVPVCCGKDMKFTKAE